jgi:hypothetical protein
MRKDPYMFCPNKIKKKKSSGHLSRTPEHPDAVWEVATNNTKT